MKKLEPEFPWLKNRGYLHLSNQINLVGSKERILSLLRDEKFIAGYAFYPLIHAIIKERRYKTHGEDSSLGKCHSYKKDDGRIKHNAKKRPLHYATHLDAIIFGYYSEIVSKRYEEIIAKYEGLSDCISAYRKIPSDIDGKNKGTIHFANETFSEIKRRATQDDCVALKFDIKSFFNEIDHTLLKGQWAELLGKDKLPNDHYNIFKAATRFSYIMRDELRLEKKYYGRRSGFDEKKIARNRKLGIHSFFESAKEFREAIKSGDLKIHKFPFWKNGKPVGIPQGLPISATLANLYLLKFDKDILKNIVAEYNAFYRRYSDDIIVVCKPEQATYIEAYVKNAITQCKVIISDEKTEKFIFRRVKLNNGTTRLESAKITEDNTLKMNFPFTYLGFEFYGYQTLIKSANLAKFYRRMIRSVKSKSKRAVQSFRKNPNNKPIIFKNQLYRLYVNFPLSSTDVKTKVKKLVQNQLGEYHYKTKKIPARNRSNYLSYAHRASELMDEPKIWNQIKAHKRVLFAAMSKHLKRNIERL